MKYLYLCIIFLSFNAFAGKRHDGDYLSVLSKKIQTKHLNWQKKNSKNPLNVLFIIPQKAGREVIEVAQRLNIKMHYILTNVGNAEGSTSVYAAIVKGATSAEKKLESIKISSKKYDLIVIANFYFDSLNYETQYNILSQVKKGTGLLFIYPNKTRYKKLFATPISAENKILSSISKDGLPNLLKQVSTTRLLKTYKFFKGRVAVLDYQASHLIGAHTDGMGLTAIEAYSNHWEGTFENNLVLVMKTMLWTARKDVQTRVLDLKTSIKAGVLTLAKFNKKEHIILRIRNQNNEILSRKMIALKKKNLKFKIPKVSAGLYYLDYIISNGRKTVDFGYRTFSVSSQIPSFNLTTDSNAYSKNKAFNVNLDLKTPAEENLQVIISLTDSPYERVWFREKFIIKKGQKTFRTKISKYFIPTQAGYLNVSLNSVNKIAQSAEKLLFFPKRKIQAYTTLAWDAADSRYLGKIKAKSVVARLGWKNTLATPKETEDSWANALLDQRLAAYPLRIMLGHKAGKTRQDNWKYLPKNLRKAPDAIKENQSFYNPKVQEFWKKVVEHHVKGLYKLRPILYSLGDENYFRYDAGFTKSDNKEFVNFLQMRYGTIKNLNKNHKSQWKSFREVKHYTLKEALRNNNPAAWFDHRAFMEKQYSDIHKFLSKEIKKYDPNAKVGAEGSLPADLEKTIDGLEFWGPYSDLVLDEVLRSIAPEKIRTLWWGGYVDSYGGRKSYPLRLWRDLLKSTINGSAWFTAQHATSQGLLGSDLTPAAYFLKMWPFLKHLQNGLGHLLVKTPVVNDNIAILWSHESDSARLISPKFVNPRDSMSVFMRYCYKSGIGFKFVTEKTIKKNNSLEGSKVLFLFGSSSISQNVAKKIEKWVGEGGIVIADMPPALLNEYLVSYSKNPLANLFGNITVAKMKKTEYKPLHLKKSYNNSSIELDTELALQRIKSNLFQTKKYKKGKTILFNFSLSVAASNIDLTSDKNMSYFFKNIFESVNIIPRVSIDGLKDDETIVRVREGNGFKMIGLLAGKKDRNKRFTLKLNDSKKVYIYTPGKGYLGDASTWNVNTKVPFQLFAIFPKIQVKPSVTGSVQTLSSGTPLKLDLSKIEKGRVLLVRIKNPDEKYLHLRNKVIYVDGKIKTYSLQFPYTDPKGIYTIEVKDMSTDLSSKIKIELK